MSNLRQCQNCSSAKNRNASFTKDMWTCDDCLSLMSPKSAAAYATSRDLDAVPPASISKEPVQLSPAPIKPKVPQEEAEAAETPKDEVIGSKDIVAEDTPVHYALPTDPDSFMVRNPIHFAREFTLGAACITENPDFADELGKLKAKNKMQKLPEAPHITKVILITQAPEALHLHGTLDDHQHGGGPCVDGFEVLCHDIPFPTGTLTMGEKSLRLHFWGNPLLEEIEMQCCTWLEGGDRLERKISYLRLKTSGRELVFGQPEYARFDGDHSLFSPVEKAEGQLLLVGIGSTDKRPVALQVVDLRPECKNISDAVKTTVYYNNGSLMSLTHPKLQEGGTGQTIAIEHDDVWNTFLAFVDSLGSSTLSPNEVLLNVIPLLEDTLAGDFAAIHSVFRIDRLITHAIQQGSPLATSADGPSVPAAKLLSVKQMWSIFASGVERCKRLALDEPELNVFSIAFLERSSLNWTKAFFVFICQMTLIIVTIAHLIDGMDEAPEAYGLVQGIVACFATIFVAFRVRDAHHNFNNFAAIFPEYRNNTLCTMDWVANKFNGVLSIILTFLVLFFTTEYLDLVLNSTAVAFVLEFDNMQTGASKNLYRGFIIRDMISELVSKVRHEPSASGAPQPNKE